MAKRGRMVEFHGAFKSKADAVRKEREVGRGAYIDPVKIRGKRRYLVLTRRRG